MKKFKKSFIICVSRSLDSILSRVLETAWQDILHIDWAGTCDQGHALTSGSSSVKKYLSIRCYIKWRFGKYGEENNLSTTPCPEQSTILAVRHSHYRELCAIRIATKESIPPVPEDLKETISEIRLD